MVESTQAVINPTEFKFNSRITEHLRVLPGDNIKLWEETKASITGKTIGTHSEVFHCDEVLATTMLLHTKEYKDAVIVRTRNQEVLDQMDIVCDVGGVFDPAKSRFDHHQRSFNMTWTDEENIPIDETAVPDPTQPVRIKLSSAGLIYRYFGKEILKNILDEVWDGLSSKYSEADMERIHYKLYKNFIQEIDALDNGVKIAKDERYWINTGLGTRVSRYNKAWNAPEGVCWNGQFKKAMKVVEEELYWQIYSIAVVFMPARKQVEESWNKREEFNASGELMYIENSCPWKDHLFNIEAEQSKEGLIKFVFFKDTRGMTRIQTVPPKGSGFDMRVPLCKAWRGLRAEEIKKVSPEF